MTISRFAVAFVVPVALFGVLYVVAVGPQRARARLAQHQLGQARAKVARALSPERRVPEDLTLTFDARHDQVGTFFWTLPAFAALDVRFAELSAAAEGLVHVTVGLRAHEHDHQVAATLAESGSEPRWSRNPFVQRLTPSPNVAVRPVSIAPPVAADPVVSGILVSGGRRLAVVDGRIVGPGDLLGATTVRSIEPEAIVIAGPDGRARRVPVRRPATVSTGPM